PGRRPGDRGAPSGRIGPHVTAGVPCRGTTAAGIRTARTGRDRRHAGSVRSYGRGPMIRTRCEVLSNRRTGAYHSITLVAPDIADQAKPGQFVEIAVPQGREILLRRPFSIHQASRRGGWAGTLEVVLDAVGPGTTWLSEVKAHDVVDVIGPLGRPFSVSEDFDPCL